MQVAGAGSGSAGGRGLGASTKAGGGEEAGGGRAGPVHGDGTGTHTQAHTHTTSTQDSGRHGSGHAVPHSATRTFDTYSPNPLIGSPAAKILKRHHYMATLSSTCTRSLTF